MIAQFTGCTLAEADEARRALGDVEGMAEVQALVLPAGAWRAATPRRLVEQIWKVLAAFALVRVLQGPRRRVRAADLPVGLAQDPLPGALPGRGAHPRPGHVPQAADPRRRPPVRHRGARPRRQRQREDVRRRARSTTGRDGRLPDGRRSAALRHPAGAVGGQGHLRGRGRPDRRGPALPLADRLLAPRAGLPAGGGAAGAGRRVRRLYGIGDAAAGAAGGARSPGATCCSRSPTSTATPARSTASVDAPRAGGRRGRRARPARPRRPRPRRRGRRDQQRRPRPRDGAGGRGLGAGAAQSQAPGRRRR